MFRYEISNSVLLQPSKQNSGGMGGPSVSRYAEETEEVIPDDQKNVFDWCKEGHVTKLAAMVTEENINEKDEQVSESLSCHDCNSRSRVREDNPGLFLIGGKYKVRDIGGGQRED